MAEAQRCLEAVGTWQGLEQEHSSSVAQDGDFKVLRKRLGVRD